VRALLDGYGSGDLDAVKTALAEDVVAYVTTADGGADRVEGRAAYLARLPDLRAAGGSLEVTMVEAQPAHSDAFWS
jgi:ketosteroid isomerase-like protein